jgi:TatD DNase family protein
MTWYFDSHIHLSDPAYVPDMEFTLKQMEHLKIKACCVSMDYENSLQTLDLAEKSELVLPFIGIHPECANEDIENISKLIQNVQTKTLKTYQN